MNVLILTPDAVGSTLLQRMLTIYMQFHTFDRPVINLHELTNGLEKYYSPEFNREIVSKKAVKNWGYYQTLQQVVEMLSSADHYKTSRLAHYHIRLRHDSLQQQIPFYNYLNENFFIISCRRANVFEHALSMTLNKITKKLNVYDAYEKIDSFYSIYQSGIHLDPKVFLTQLDSYKKYIEWSEQYFNISSYFNYEHDVPNLEQYILNLPVFVDQPKLTSWKDNFGVNFNDWNKMHYVRSDLNKLSLSHDDIATQLLLENHTAVEYYQQQSPQEWPAVNSINDIVALPHELRKQFAQQIISQQGIIPMLDQHTQQKLAQYHEGYTKAQDTINQMICLGIIINGPPIKKQTLAEKQKIIKNFQELVDVHNNWAKQHPEFASVVDSNTMSQQVVKESSFWDSLINSATLLPSELPSQQ